MKKILIVLAHPYETSFNHQLSVAAIEQFNNKKYSIEILDLFKDRILFDYNVENNFKKNVFEFENNYKNNQKKAHETQSYSDFIKLDQDRLLEADIVIYQFPLWWFSMPSVMRNWIEKTYSYGFAYNGREGKWFQNGVFNGKKAMLSITTSGPATSYTNSGVNGDINKILWPIQNGILNFLGYEVLEPNICWGTDTENFKERDNYIKEYINILDNIDSRNCLILPKI